MALKAVCSIFVAVLLVSGWGSAPAQQSSRYGQPSQIPLREGYLSQADFSLLKSELLYQRRTSTQAGSPATSRS